MIPFVVSSLDINGCVCTFLGTITLLQWRGLCVPMNLGARLSGAMCSR